VAIGRRIRDNRSTAILASLVALSLLCLASDTRAAVLGDGLRTVISVITHPVWLALNGIQRGTDYTAGLVLEYDQAHKESQYLRTEMAKLITRSADRAELQAENARLREMLGFVRAEPSLTMIPAGVINRNPDGTLKLDVGTRYGVEEGMGVITKDGVIGIIARADPFQSTVFTLNHPQCNISAITERNRVASWVQGSGSLISEMCNLVYLDMKDDVRKGDVVVTNSGTKFPRGIPIGTVVDKDPGALLQAASVRPAADPYRVEEVFVVSQAQPDPDDLAGPPMTRQSAAPKMPDTRTEQEKHAP
jgi:rod shape-determining protein MreC